jgi:hypothetical protein
MQAPQAAGAWALALDVLLAPSQAVARIAQRRRTLFFSLAAFVIVFVALWSLYYSRVDFVWLKGFLADLGVRMHPGISASQVRQGMEKMTLPAMVMSTMVGGLATIIVEVLGRTVYHHLTAHVISERPVPFGSWFALVSWSILPATLTLVLALANLYYADASHLAPSQVTLSTLNSAWLHLPSGHPWHMWASSFDLRLVWTVLITGAGLHAWLGVSWAKAVFWAALPYVVFYGVWAALVN